MPPPDTPHPSFENDAFNPISQRLKSRKFVAATRKVALTIVLKPLQSKKPPVMVPRVIILSLSGMRCADVVRAVKPFKGQGEVAKVCSARPSKHERIAEIQLFAKHFKFEEQVKYLAKTRVSIAVGTPARVSKLLVEGEQTLLVC